MPKIMRHGEEKLSQFIVGMSSRLKHHGFFYLFANSFYLICFYPNLPPEGVQLCWQTSHHFAIPTLPWVQHCFRVLVVVSSKVCLKKELYFGCQNGSFCGRKQTGKLSDKTYFMFHSSTRVLWRFVLHISGMLSRERNYCSPRRKGQTSHVCLSDKGGSGV